MPGTGNTLLVSEHAGLGGNEKHKQIFLDPALLNNLDKCLENILSNDQQNSNPRFATLHNLASGSSLDGGDAKYVKVPEIATSSMGCPIIPAEQFESFIYYMALAKRAQLFHQEMTDGNDWNLKSPKGREAAIKNEEKKTARYHGTNIGYPNWECVSALSIFVLRACI